MHVHMHTLVLDGVFVAEPDGQLVFHPAPPPTDAEVAQVASQVRRRIGRLLRRRGIGDEAADTTDPLADESTALAGLTAAAVRGRAALGRRAGRGPQRLGADPDAPWIDRSGPLHAHDAGYDLHAAVVIPGGDRPGLERMCRYVFRPPLGQQRLRRLVDGRVAVALQHEWADGTTHLVFTPGELLERRATLVPRPRVNFLLYHGVLAPNVKWRRAIVPVGPAASGCHPEASMERGPSSAPALEEAPSRRRDRPRYRAWASLMRRAFGSDVLACPQCGGRMVVLATIEDPTVIRRILRHLGLSLDAGDPASARGSPDENECAD